MSNLIFNYHFVQVDMLRMCCALVFIGLTVAAHAAWAEEGFFAHEIQQVRGWPLPYRLSAGVAFTRSEDAAPVGPVFNSTPRPHFVAEPKQEAIWPTNARWQFASDGDRVSLSPLLRFGSKEERIEIKPRRHSIWFVWRKEIP